VAGKLPAVAARVAALERALAKFRGAYNGTAKRLGDAVEGLNLLMFGEPESLPKSKAELGGFTPNIVRMIRAISYDEACKRKTVRDR
jgi:hypothetical protein